MRSIRRRKNWCEQKAESTKFHESFSYELEEDETGAKQIDHDRRGRRI